MKGKGLFSYTLILLLAAGLRLIGLWGAPPGLHYDEAADLLLTRDIALYGATPFPVVTAYSGREALFYYLAAPLVRIIGVDVVATRLTSAFLGILTVAVTLALGRRLFKDHPSVLWMAGIAGVALAINGAQVWLTRQGFRTSPQPLLIALSLWCIWIAIQRRKRTVLPALLGGFFGGLALYVYIAARIYPVWLVALLILSVGVGWVKWRTAGWIVIGLIVSALPLGYFYLSQPNILWERLSQVAPGESTLTLLQSLEAHLKMFFIAGDPLLRYNLYPGRPWFDLVTGLFFVMGLLVGLRNFRRKAYTWVGLSLLMIAPSVIAVGGLPPSHMRSVSIVPLIFFIPALGLVAFRKIYGWRLLVVGLGIAGALHTAYDYRAWSTRADLFYDSDGDLAIAARWLERTVPPTDLVYIWSVYYEHPTVLASRLEYTQIRWQMREQLFIPPPNRSAWVILPRSVKPPPGLLTRLVQVASPVSVPNGPDGSSAFQAWRIDAGRTPPPVPETRFAELIGVTGVTVNSILRENNRDRLMTAYTEWQIVNQPADSDLTPTFTLRDSCESLITAPRDLYFEQTSRWLPGETLYTATEWTLPPGITSDSATVTVALARRGSPTPLISVGKSDHPTIPRSAATERFPIRLPIDSWRQFQLPTAPPLIPDLYALAITPPPATLRTGDSFGIGVTWLAGKTLPQTLPVTLHTPSGILPMRACRDYPLERLEPGQQLTVTYQARLPVDHPVGRGSLTLRVADQTVWSGEIETQGVTRSFTVPALNVPLTIEFEDQISLRGAQIEERTEMVEVSLAWQVTGALRSEYTVFIHLVDQAGQIIGQVDQPLDQAGVGWGVGEVRLETYRIARPREGYTVRVGLYDLYRLGRRMGSSAGEFVTIGK